MSVHEGNREQADFWTQAGPLWARMQQRFDQQASPFGLAAIDAVKPQPAETVLGTDISSTMIEAARARMKPGDEDVIHFEVGDAHTDVFDGTHDLAISRFGVMFFADPTAAFTNIITALCSGGRLGFVCWQSPDVNPWIAKPFAVIRAHLDIPWGRDPHAPGPFAFADADRVSGILHDAGFIDIDVVPTLRSINLGTDLDEAVDFQVQLTPAVRSLAETDPPTLESIREGIRTAYGELITDDGVQSPAAAWVFTARKA